MILSVKSLVFVAEKARWNHKLTCEEAITVGVSWLSGKQYMPSTYYE